MCATFVARVQCDKWGRSDRMGVRFEHLLYENPGIVRAPERFPWGDVRACE